MTQIKAAGRDISKAEEKPPILFSVVKWYGYVFALTFVLYGGVQLVLGFMDRDYEEFEQKFIFLILGVILLTVCYAFRDLKNWGWYGMVAINGLIVLLALIGLGSVYNIILMVLSLAAIGALCHPIVKTRVFSAH